MNTSDTIRRAVYGTAAGLILGAVTIAIGIIPSIAAPGDEIRIGSVIEHPFSGATVKGAPFSAQVIFESTQTFAGDLHTSRSMTGALYRDSAGRTRQELPGTGAPDRIAIYDPVGGVRYSLQMSERTVRSIAAGSTISHVEAEAREAMERELKERQILAAGGASPAGESLPEKSVETLGTRTIEGLQAIGTRVTLTIPTGSEGNDRPFTVVSEKWYSPELQMVVIFKTSDPRRGDSIYRLTQINRGEQPRGLFEPPPDFMVVDEVTEQVHTKVKIN